MILRKVVPCRAPCGALKGINPPIVIISLPLDPFFPFSALLSALKGTDIISIVKEGLLGMFYIALRRKRQKAVAPLGRSILKPEGFRSVSLPQAASRRHTDYSKSDYPKEDGHTN